MTRIKVDIWRLGSKIIKKALQDLGVQLVRTRGVSYWQPGRAKIGWNPRHGLTSLLHETGHASLCHRSDPDWASKVGREAEAWVWAEEAAYLWGLPFDYRGADRAFSTYTRRVRGAEGWKVMWRYK